MKAYKKNVRIEKMVLLKKLIIKWMIMNYTVEHI